MGEEPKPGTRIAAPVLVPALALGAALALAAGAWALRPAARRWTLRQARNAAAADDPSSALVWLRAAGLLAPLGGEEELERGWHLERLGRPEAALAAYARAARRLPRGVGDAEVAVARLLAARGDLDRAADALAAGRARDATVDDDARGDALLAAARARLAEREAQRR